MPTFPVYYDRTEEDIRRIAEDSDHPLESPYRHHPLESPYRQACIKWVEENPLPTTNPNDLPAGTVFTHKGDVRTTDPVEYVALGGGRFLRTLDGVRGLRNRTRGFWNLSGITIVWQP